MPRFTFKIKNSVIDGSPCQEFTLRVGSNSVGSAELMKKHDEPFWRLDNFKVKESGKGYPYALTYCMLRAAMLKGATEAIIPSAHDGMIGVGAAGFTQIADSLQKKKRRNPKTGEITEVLHQVSFRTTDLPYTIAQQKAKMEAPKYDLKEQVSNEGSRCCYITTAVCQSLGFGDDCDELMALRAFRDEVLLPSEEGRRDVERYYAIAPGIVAAIDARSDAAAIYRDLYARYIAPSVAAVADGRDVDSYTLFRAMVEETAARFTPGA